MARLDGYANGIELTGWRDIKRDGIARLDEYELGSEIVIHTY